MVRRGLVPFGIQHRVSAVVDKSSFDKPQAGPKGTEHGHPGYDEVARRQRLRSNRGQAAPFDTGPSTSLNQKTRMAGRCRCPRAFSRDVGSESVFPRSESSDL